MKKGPKDQYKPAEKLELRELKKDLPKVFKKVSCPSCEKEVDAVNLSLPNSMAKCGSCNVIFSIEKEVESVKATEGMKQETFRPEGIDLFYYKDELDITVQEHLQGLVAFGLMIVPIAAIVAILFFFSGKKDISPYIPTVLSLLSFYLIYKGFNASKNHSIININDKSLSIKSRPKNFKKDKTYAAEEIDQLYLKHDANGMGHFTIHMVVNGLEGQKHEKLITVNTLSKAKYLEQEIELYLDIEDRKVLEANV